MAYIEKKDNNSLIIHEAKCSILKEHLKTNKQNISGSYFNLSRTENEIKNKYNGYHVEYCPQCLPPEKLKTLIDYNLKNKTPFKLTREIKIPDIDAHQLVNGVKSWFVYEGIKIEQLNEDERISGVAHFHRTRYYSSTDHIEVEFKQGDTSLNVLLSITQDEKDKQLISLMAATYPKKALEFENYVQNCKVIVAPEDVNTVQLILDAIRYTTVRRPAFNRISQIVYQDMNPLNSSETLGFGIISLVLVVAFYAYFYRGHLNLISNNYLPLLLTYLPAFIGLYLMYRSDKFEKEPIAMVLLCFSWGVFAGAIAAPLNSYLGPIFQQLLGNGVVVAAFTEETIKSLPLLVLLYHPKFRQEFNTPLDGILYGFSVGLGFSATENFVYFLRYGTGVLIIRSLLSFGHGMYTAFVGLWLVISRVQRGSTRIIDVFPGLSVAMILHFLWNFLTPLYGLFGISQMLFYHALFQLSFLLKMVREARRDEVLWGFSDASK